MMRFLRQPLSASLCLVVIGFALQPSTGEAAQPRAVRTKNVDEPGRVPYQVAGGVIPSNCSFNSVLYFCDVGFPAVPAGKRLVIQHVSLLVALESGSPDSLRFIDSNFAPTFWVQPTFTPRVNFPNHFFLDRPVLVYQEPGTVPTLTFASSGPPSSAQVTLHGYLIAATN